MKRFLVALLVIAIAGLAGAQTPEDFGNDFTAAAAAGYYTYPAELAGAQLEPGEYLYDGHIVLYEFSPWSVAVSADYFFDVTVTISEDQVATIASGRWWKSIPWDEYCSCYLTQNDPPAGTYKIDALSVQPGGFGIHWTGTFTWTGSVGPWYGWKDAAFRTATELIPIPPEPEPAAATVRTTTRTRRGGERRPK